MQLTWHTDDSVGSCVEVLVFLSSFLQKLVCIKSKNSYERDPQSISYIQEYKVGPHQFEVEL